MAINLIQPTIANFIGNEQIKSQIISNVIVSKKQNKSFPHTLIYGVSGMGKTSLAYAIANEMGSKCIEVGSGNVQANGLTPIILKISQHNDHSILLLDEIHSLPTTVVENIIYRIIDEGIINIRYPDGNVRMFKLPNSFTIIGTTTEVFKLQPPLLNRFQLSLKLKSYNHDEMIDILKLYLSTHLTITNEAYATLASATQYIPRKAVVYSTQLLNYALQYNLTSIDLPTMHEALKSWGIDEHGLSDDDQEYIRLLYETFNNSPTGLKQITSILNESEGIIIERENHLIRQGLLVRTGRGRMLTPEGLLLSMSL